MQLKNGKYKSENKTKNTTTNTKSNKANEVTQPPKKKVNVKQRWVNQNI